MAAGVSVLTNFAEIQATLLEPWFGELLEAYGQQVATRARANAPKRSGAGAASIHVEVVIERGELVALISWDETHAYMRFTDLGTRYISARHYLEQALNR